MKKWGIDEEGKFDLGSMIEDGGDGRVLCWDILNKSLRLSYANYVIMCMDILV